MLGKKDGNEIASGFPGAYDAERLLVQCVDGRIFVFAEPSVARYARGLSRSEQFS